MKFHLVLPALAAIAFLLTGCASSTVNYNFVYLKTGPESARKTPEESKTIFQGHMSNMQRLAAEKKLVVAGPFDKPADPTWRGIFIFDVESTDAARDLVKTDPGIQSGVFIQETHPFAASPDLRRMFELEKELQAARAANPTEPPKNIRGYIMITAADAAKARATLAASSYSGSIIFSGTFSDTHAAIFVLDATSAQEVRDTINRDHADLGPCSIDGWWSSTSLAGLLHAKP